MNRECLLSVRLLIDAWNRHFISVLIASNFCPEFWQHLVDLTAPFGAVAHWLGTTALEHG